MIIYKWYYIDSFRVEYGHRALNYCYLDNEVCYIYKGKEKKNWNKLPIKHWSRTRNKYNIKPSYTEVTNG